MIREPGCYGQCEPRRRATWRSPFRFQNSCDECRWLFRFDGPRPKVLTDEWFRITRWQLTRFYVGQFFREIRWHRLATKIQGKFWN